MQRYRKCYITNGPKATRKKPRALYPSVMSKDMSEASVELRDCFDKVVSSYTGAIAAYQIWFTLRGKDKAIETYLDDMNDRNYVDFFHATNSGNYKLIFIETASLFDPDDRAASIRTLKSFLNRENLSSYSSKMDQKLGKYGKLVSNILTVRSKIIAHRDIGTTPAELYKKHGIKPVEIKQLLNDCGEVLQEIEAYLTSNSTSSSVCTTDRFEKATFGLLETLKNGRNS